MNAPSRGPFQGVVQILRFNWPIYATAAGILIAGAVVIPNLPLPRWIRIVIWFAIGLAGLWLAISLVVSHYIYDRAGIYDGEWLSRVFPEPPARFANLHAGFDEFSGLLINLFPRTEALVLDFFDPRVMTEPSIARARTLVTGQAKAQAVNFRSLPFADQEIDAAFLLFAAHELRDTYARVQLLHELRRVLQPGGKIVIAEHLRDLPNFLAFGPGCFHFHSHGEWLRNFAAAGLGTNDEFRLTAFVRVFVLQEGRP